MQGGTLGKISLAACLGRRVLRPACRCCGGADGVRRAFSRKKGHDKKTWRDLK